LIKPRVDTPALRAVANKFVEDAVVEKKLVEVAEFEVESNAVKFWRVEEADERNPPTNVESPLELTIIRSIPPVTIRRLSSDSLYIPVFWSEPNEYDGVPTAPLVPNIATCGSNEVPVNKATWAPLTAKRSAGEPPV
jgi:hypothetical protein